MGAVFILTVCVCMLLELLVAKIPQAAIKENAKKSAMFYHTNGLHPQEKPYAAHTRKDYYADTVLLNIISSQDENTPIKSVVSAPYFDEESMSAAEDYMAVAFSDAEPNSNYFRYWHGSMVWLKPLLFITDIEGVFLLYRIMTIGLLALIIIRCIIKKKWEISIAFLMAFGISGGWETVSCLEYGNTMLYVLLMTGIYSLTIQNEINLFQLSVVNGVLTCFIDFLTIETLAFTLPTAMWMLMKSDGDENRSKKKNGTVVLKALSCWGLSYAGMFLLKWILAAVMLGKQGLMDSFQRTASHIYGNAGTALFYNIRTMLHGMPFPEWVQICMVTVYAILVFYVVSVLWKRKRADGIIVALMPYLRYIVVSEHSYTHHYFTYRAQMVTVLFIVFILFKKYMDNRSRGIKNV